MGARIQSIDSDQTSKEAIRRYDERYLATAHWCQASKGFTTSRNTSGSASLTPPRMEGEDDDITPGVTSQPD
jgi:hypothetical protein